MPKQMIRLGDGGWLPLSQYMTIVRHAFAHPDATFPRSFQSWVSCDGQTIIHEHYEMIHDLINRHIEGYGQGRKWRAEYQTGLLRDACRIKEKLTRRVRVYQMETPELARRFSYLLSTYHED